MEELGANTIRVYHIDPDSDHDGCMEAFADAGVYVFVDLDTFTTDISEVSFLLGRIHLTILPLTLGNRTIPTGM
jgi:glycosyl hydrolase family 72 (putative glucanosyltransferase)